jgi:hexosaminidase
MSFQGKACLLYAMLNSLPLLAQQPPVKSPLLVRGYTVIPEPQRVSLGNGDFRFGADWRLQPGPGVPPNDVAVETLREDLSTRFRLRLNPLGKAGVVHLEIQPGSIAVGEALDHDKQLLAEEAYRIELSPQAVRITANAPAGLFYGAETLVQLLKRENGNLLLPQGEIVDWPDLQFRGIYWDDAHHLERMDYLKRALRQTAFFKINAFVIKLEGHFQYKSAPALVEPYALSPAELQEVTDYGIRYHIQLIPYLDGPAHIAFILKHPEYAGLREYPENNYELCATNPDSYKLMYGMFQDLLDANKGVKYFYLSTDEAYYAGKADNAQCHEAVRAAELGSVGKMLGEFTTKTADYLHDRGRTVVFWGELPMKPADIPSFPSHLVNGETYGHQFDAAFKAHGIREMIYVSTQGEEKLFPNYFILPADRRLHAGRAGAPAVPEAVQGAVRKIASDSAREEGAVIGAITAAWADAGLHTEDFWLGYATIPAAAWHPGGDPRDSMTAFYPLFYGSSATSMDRVYELMSQQAQFYVDSWETGPSKERKPILGNSRAIYDTPHPANDQSIPLPPAPRGKDLSYDSTWAKDNARRLQLVSPSLADIGELLGLLDRNLRLAEFNRYSLEVFRSIAGLYRQNLEMLQDLGKIDGLFTSARERSQVGSPKEALAALDRALDLAQEIRSARNKALAEATATWYQTWYPRVAEANGRRFLHELDDIKDHPPDRTVDMSYLVYRELLLPFGEWFDEAQTARNEYAQSRGLAARHDRFDWKDYGIPGK